MNEETTYNHEILSEISTEIPAEELNDSIDGSELESFESVEIEEKEFLEIQQVESVLESLFFSYDRPISLGLIKQAFRGTNVNTALIRQALENLKVEYAGGKRGVTLEEVASGYQLRTKLDNQPYLKNIVKIKPFKLSGPALEVLSIVAYKQPVIKSEVDNIRGVESGHLLRALMERNLVCFSGKSELPGKPMYYGTTRKFLEIFGLRNLKELPSISEIDELLPDGIDVEEKKENLEDLTTKLSEEVRSSYSQGEEELSQISDHLTTIETTTLFFEEEKRRQKAKKDLERSQDLKEALLLGEEVSEKDRKWLQKYEESLSELNGDTTNILF